LTTATAAFSTSDKLLRARTAAPLLAEFATAEKNSALLAMVEAIDRNIDSILIANRKDLKASELSGAARDRLTLDKERLAAMCCSVREIIALDDPVHEILAEWVRPNGLHIRKVRVPLGVVGIIYESRPNVTVDAAALTLKTANAVVLRGGREAAYTNECLVEVLTGVPGLPPGSIELLDSSSRDSVQELIKARGLVDVLIPRGGPQLIDYVVRHATVPVIETGAGNCHIFVDDSADLEMADRIIINAKTQRPSVCNAAEKLLVHEAVAAQYIPHIAQLLTGSGVELRGDPTACRLAGECKLQLATEQDWSEEYLRLCMAVHVVANVDDAIAHINHYSTKHSEAIVTSNEAHASAFLRRVDSAAVYWNASTRFSDGWEFGFGAEVGISTQKLHCRGPFALPELTSTKYQIIGQGQVRK
jgi:glutamate-5-semialdehyde dehydrogenase